MDNEELKMLRKTTLNEMDRSFDVQFWQRQGPEAIFKAAREMVIFAYKQKGWPLDERLRRDVVQVRKLRG